MGGPPPFSGGLSVEEEAMIGAVDDGNSFAKKTQLSSTQSGLLFYVGIRGLMISRTPSKTHDCSSNNRLCPDN